MKDEKLDVILNEHLHDHNENIWQIQYENILGSDFIQQMSQRFPIELNEKLEEAVQIMQGFIKTKEFCTLRGKKLSKLKEFRECLLSSFIAWPDLDYSKRKLYVDVYVRSQNIDNKSASMEENITAKVVSWFQEYRKNHHENLDADFQIALMAVTDQVFKEGLTNDLKGLQKNMH